MKADEFGAFVERIKTLTNNQVLLLSEMAEALQWPVERKLLADSDLVSEGFSDCFADEIRKHHASSNEPLSKDKFEYALSRIMHRCGRSVRLAPRNNRGHDIEIDGQRFSLKTQADKNIKLDHLHISKFMELDRENWEDLRELRDDFLEHMTRYDRILSLRCFAPGAKARLWAYELVEVPKKLLMEAADGELQISHKSRRKPMPGHCIVSYREGESHAGGNLKFRLYFDGGGEQKLQVQKIARHLCTVHGEWKLIHG